ncbi:MmcQ/YjbR family DNA-binding protein [Thermobifida alba]|uniref:MmcQ/YjbR family DNA-binding protein n=1 Tax=Thermobifida alba TaxID=53522 RepID=A0ABY4L5E9_THEAE|nr:MmcQ/YjbR family DNA-binding protein [Thermobifida alba]UPT22599.1 MmcQ/YjbR family DNA-binding protein [Thermobifida alba]
MTPQQFIDAALWFPEAVETEPFGPGTLVYKVAGRMFALLSERNREGVPFVTLKCDPDLALELRAEFDAVFPGYHTDKRHWNSVLLDGTVPDDELLEMLRHSYQQVVARLRRADRERLLAVLGEDAPPLP